MVWLLDIVLGPRGVLVAALLTTFAAMAIATGLAWSMYDAYRDVVLVTTPVITFITAFPICLFVWDQVRHNAELRQKLETIVNQDPLTGVASRNFFFETVGRRVPLDGVLLMADIDHFKRVNDTFGHWVGDDVIRHVADLLQTGLSGQDCVARFGGEEFAIFLAAPVAQAEDAAEALRALIADTPAVSDEREVSVTVSIGLAHPIPGAGLEAAIKAADEALYAAKSHGRNQVVVAKREISRPRLTG